MSQGIYDTITYDQVLAFTKRTLLISGTTEHDALLETLLNEAVGQINNLRMVIPRSCVKDITNGNLIKLPNGFNKLIGLRFIKETSSQSEQEGNNAQMIKGHDYLFEDLVYLNYKWMLDCQVDTTSIHNNLDYKGFFDIKDGYIVFQSAVADVYSQAQIAFSGTNVDEDGKFIIYSDYERAIRNYAAAEFAELFPDKYTPSFVGTRRATWTAQKKFLKGKDQERHWENNKFQIQKIIHSFFIDEYVAPGMP